MRGVVALGVAVTGTTMASIVVVPIHHGFVPPADGLVVVTQEEVFGSRVARRRDRRTKSGAEVQRPVQLIWVLAH